MTSSATPRRSTSLTSSSPDRDISDVLHEHGLRRTAQRIAVLHVLNGTEGRHLTTAQIHERLLNAGVEADLATVYRTITKLLNLGIVHATAYTEQATSYGLAGDSHHHAVCTRCGTVIQITAGDLHDALGPIHRATGFQPDHVAVHGVCSDCQAT